MCVCLGASDATFHIMWVILFNAVDDFGVREFNEAIRMKAMTNDPAMMAIESVKHKILDEALHGALRVAGLVSCFGDVSRSAER